MKLLIFLGVYVDAEIRPGLYPPDVKASERVHIQNGIVIFIISIM